jgi:DNA-binding MurR/RpiR family transcriptional regulator
MPLAQDLDIRVAKARGGLSDNDERVLAFVRGHLAELAFHTAESLAQGAGVSPAAVVRFARRLGYASFRDLRDRARDELRTTPDGAGESTEPSSTLARKVERDVASLETLAQLLEEPLEEASTALANARAIWFLANRETYGLAVYAHRLMHLVRRDVRLVDPSFPEALRALSPDDAIVACSFRPYARLTLELIAYARQVGATVVLVTDGLSHDFIEPEDIVLAVPVESPTLLLSFTPVVCALEALTAQVAMADADHTHDTLAASTQFLTRHELVVERGLGSRPPKPADAKAGPRG